jgi:hypothetical protein
LVGGYRGMISFGLMWQHNLRMLSEFFRDVHDVSHCHPYMTTAHRLSRFGYVNAWGVCPLDSDKIRIDSFEGLPIILRRDAPQRLFTFKHVILLLGICVFTDNLSVHG